MPPPNSWTDSSPEVCVWFLAICQSPSHSKNGVKETFGAVTNGTFSRELMQPLLESKKMSLTFSLDGPGDVQNLLRPFVSKKGSFNTVLGNLLWAQEFIDAQVECTFTPDHVMRGYSLVKLITGGSQSSAPP